MRPFQLGGGLAVVTFLLFFNYFGYQREKQIKSVFAAIRARFEARQAETVFISGDELETIVGRRG